MVKDYAPAKPTTAAPNTSAGNLSTELPLILSNETNNIIYGPESTPIEQINSSSGAVTYLHHDQAGSTRLLTGSTGTVAGKCSYGTYGTPTCEGTASTPLGYDAQYTNTDTGLIYLRAREYDPARHSSSPVTRGSRSPANPIATSPTTP
jgi:hypothetical protein